MIKQAIVPVRLSFSPRLAGDYRIEMAAAANQYGSLIFCSRCGTLLDLPGDEDHLVCDGCGQVEDATGQSGVVSRALESS